MSVPQDDMTKNEVKEKLEGKYSHATCVVKPVLTIC